MARVLITGGAGFIGSHAANALLAAGYEVRLLDNLSPQVHGSQRHRPIYLNKDAELRVGDITDAVAVDRALRGVDMVLHLASAVGVGQSMYDIASYVKTNEFGTATLLEALSKRPVERLVVASSMSIYGEGLCRSTDGFTVAPAERPIDQLKMAKWELGDERGGLLEPLPTPETKQPSLSSIYALNKYAQERMCLITGKAYGIPTLALRFWCSKMACSAAISSTCMTSRAPACWRSKVITATMRSTSAPGKAERSCRSPAIWRA
jgi:dTDP-L-rhamnose 4-epimerase